MYTKCHSNMEAIFAQGLLNRGPRDQEREVSPPIELSELNKYKI